LENPGAPTINVKNVDGAPPWVVPPENPGVPIINVKNVNGGPLGPSGGPVPIQDPNGVL
jgi:hypothetical protein